MWKQFIVCRLATIDSRQHRMNPRLRAPVVRDTPWCVLCPSYNPRMHEQIVSSALNTFHLCGRPDIVRLLDDPAYVPEDEIVVIPYGCSPISFLIETCSNI